MAVKDHIRVRKFTVEQEIGRLETFVSRMERRYECPTPQMAKDVSEGRARHTAEVDRWLADYQALIRLREIRAHGRVTG